MFSGYLDLQKQNMAKRKFIGLGRKPKSAALTDIEMRKEKEKQRELPDNFILGFTNQHPELYKTKPKKKVNSEE